MTRPKDMSKQSHSHKDAGKNKGTGVELQLGDIKESLDDIIYKLKDIDKCRAEINDLSGLVRHLTLQNELKDKKIQDLEKRVEELEQYTRQDEVVITGLKTRHKSYARATHSDEILDSQDAPHEELISLEKQVSDFIVSKMGVELNDSDISACHTLPSKSSVPKILIKFTNRKIKTSVMRQGKRLKGTNVFVNEHLTSKNSKLAATARQLRKERKILNTWTRNCKVFVKLLGTGDQVKIIREMEDFKNLNLT